MDLVQVNADDTLKAAAHKDIHWPVVFMGVLSTILLSAGVLRHYWDIYIHRTVRGISFIFVGIDAAGDVFSLVSICKYLNNLYQLLFLKHDSFPAKARYPRDGHLCHRVRALVRRLRLRRLLQSPALGSAEAQYKETEKRSGRS